ncbi:MAG TPA: hypothetical protein VEA79_02455 [Phenylobacterium sp.]|nr:hypothetical protein [Phenylobacterium sp.]
MPAQSRGAAAIHAACHCGAVRLEIARKPRSVTQCNCSVCRRYGAMWAYYTRKSVRLIAEPGAVGEYSWRNHRLQFCHCTVCGGLTHYKSRNETPDGRFAVNGRMIDPAVMASVPIKLLDGDGDWKVLETRAQPDLFVSPVRRKRPG